MSDSANPAPMHALTGNAVARMSAGPTAYCIAMPAKSGAVDSAIPRLVPRDMSSIRFLLQLQRRSLGEMLMQKYYIYMDYIL